MRTKNREINGHTEKSHIFLPQEGKEEERQLKKEKEVSQIPRALPVLIIQMENRAKTVTLLRLALLSQHSTSRRSSSSSNRTKGEQ